MEVPYVNIALQYKGLEHEILPVVKEVLKSGSYILGKELNRFEHRIAGFCRTRYAIGVANGTDALRLSLHALNIGRDDEVITAPNSFIASAGAIAAVGAKPVFVDVGEDYNINSELIENAINERTKAIMPVHLTGRPAAMNEIVDIARKHGLKVLKTRLKQLEQTIVEDAQVLWEMSDVSVHILLKHCILPEMGDLLQLTAKKFMKE